MARLALLVSLQGALDVAPEETDALARLEQVLRSSESDAGKPAAKPKP